MHGYLFLFAGNEYVSYIFPYGNQRSSLYVVVPSVGNESLDCLTGRGEELDFVENNEGFSFEQLFSGVFDDIKNRAEPVTPPSLRFSGALFLFRLLELVLSADGAAVAENVDACKVAVALVCKRCDCIAKFFWLAHSLLT